MEKPEAIINQTIDDLCTDSLVSARKLFISNYGVKVPDFIEGTKIRLMTKIHDEYSNVNKLIQ